MLTKLLLRLSLAIGIIVTISISSESSLAHELAEIKQRGKLIVAVKDNLRPLGFYDEKGNLQGLEIDIAKRLAEELLGDPDAVILQPVNNQERLTMVIDGKVDIVIARITNTDSRSRLVNLSSFYYLDGTGLVSKNPQVRSLNDLSQGKILVLNNSTTIAVIRDRLPQAQLMGVNSYQEALHLLEANQADAFAADQSILTGWIQEYPQYSLLKERLSGEALCVAVTKGLENVELLAKINKAIANWRKSGWLQQRAAYWGLPE